MPCSRRHYYFLFVFEHTICILMRDCTIDGDHRYMQMHIADIFVMVEVPERTQHGWANEEETGPRRCCLYHGGAVSAREDLVD